MLTLREVSERLERVRWTGDSFMALCPAHEDRNPSLHVSNGARNGIVFSCFASCEAEAILKRIGLEWQDVLPPRDEVRQERRETVYRICDQAGKLVAEHVRIDEPHGKKRFVWRRGGKSGLDGLSVESLPLYRSEQAATGTAWIFEGEKATDAAARMKLNAYGTVTGSASCPSEASLRVLAGRDVVLWPDNDPSGQKHMREVSKRLLGIARSIRWLIWPGAPVKGDAADYRGDPEALKGWIRESPPNGPFVMFGDRLKAAAEELDRIHQGDYSAYVPTGIRELDRHLGGGFRRGCVSLIGAPTGAGKTSLVMQFAMEAQKHGLAIVVSPEMSVESLIVREIVRRSGVPKGMRAIHVSEALRQSAAEAHTIAESDLYENPPNVAIYNDLAVNVDGLIEQIREAAQGAKLSLVALDYAQQIAADTPEKARYLAVGEVALKAIEIAREHNCAVLITSQVNVFKGERGERSYSIRESANLEQKSNTVLLFLVDRDQTTGKVTKATFRATKARDGALFQHEVEFDPSVFRVTDLGRDIPELRDWTR